MGYSRIVTLSNQIYGASYIDMLGTGGLGQTSYYYRYTEGSRIGQLYGYEAAGWDNCMARMMSLDRDFRIPGLKFTGAAGPRGDGFSESMLTGNIVGKMVLGEMAKEGK